MNTADSKPRPLVHLAARYVAFRTRQHDNAVAAVRQMLAETLAEMNATAARYNAIGNHPATSSQEDS